MFPQRHERRLKNIRSVLRENMTWGRIKENKDDGYNVVQKLLYLMVIFLLVPLMFVTGFAQMAALVAEDAEATSCEGRLVGFLEGGYHLGGLAESVVATLDVWSGGEVPPLPDNSLPDDTVKRMIHMLCDRFELTTA